MPSPYAAEPLPTVAVAGVHADPNGPTRTPLPPVTRTHLGPSRSHRRLRTRAAVASVGVVMSMAASVVAALAEIDDRAVLLWYVDAGVLLLAGICVIVWFRRAYKNLKLMGRNAYTPGWAVAGWIVPIMNLFRPYQITKELVRESPRVRSNEGTGLVSLWWMLYLIGLTGGRVVEAMGHDTPDDLIRNDLLRAAAQGAWLLAGAMLLVIIRTVTRRQDAWFDPLPDAPVPVTELR